MLMTGKILAFNSLLERLTQEADILDKELNSKVQEYNKKLNNYISISNKVYSENQENINDFKTIFSSAYNSSYKTVSETFKNEDRISYNKGFYLDTEKEAVYFKVLNEDEILYERFVVSDNEIVFFFNEDIELNIIKAIIKDNNGINIVPKEIIIHNSLGNSFFLEDFNRFFEFKENEYDVQTFISNSKKTDSIKFVFETMPNTAISTFKFFLSSYESDNEMIIKFDNEFKKNKLIKLKRRISDKYKVLNYYLSFDGANFEQFNWYDPELEKVNFEDDVKIISLPEEIPSSIFIKFEADKNVKINTSTVVKTENYIEQIVPKDFIAEDSDKFVYELNNYGGAIKNTSIKIYLSNKFAKIITEKKSELVDKVTEKGKNVIADGYINVEKTEMQRDDKFFLMDFDSLDSLENIENELGFYMNGKLYLPSLFYEENIYFRVSYDVDFAEDSNDINLYTPFIFDFDIQAGD